MVQQEIEKGNTNPQKSASELARPECEYVPLPSRGIFYKGQFRGLDKLLIRKLDYTDEDILTTKSYYDNGTLFTEILNNCIVDPCKFPAGDLVTVDRDAILWWLRIGAFGQQYVMPMKCTNPDCKSKKSFQATWDLGSFMSPELPERFSEQLLKDGTVMLDLPISKLKCRITSPTIGREQTITERLELKKSKLKLSKDFLNTGKLWSVIYEVFDKEGKSLGSTTDIVAQWLEMGNDGQRLPLVDSRYILKAAKEINLEVDTKQDIICPSCQHIQEGVRMPMSIYFFWPEFEELS